MSESSPASPKVKQEKEKENEKSKKKIKTEKSDAQLAKELAAKTEDNESETEENKDIDEEGEDQGEGEDQEDSEPELVRRTLPQRASRGARDISAAQFEQIEALRRYEALNKRRLRMEQKLSEVTAVGEEGEAAKAAIRAAAEAEEKEAQVSLANEVIADEAQDGDSPDEGDEDGGESAKKRRKSRTPGDVDSQIRVEGGEGGETWKPPVSRKNRNSKKKMTEEEASAEAEKRKAEREKKRAEKKAERDEIRKKKKEEEQKLKLDQQLAAGIIPPKKRKKNPVKALQELILSLETFNDVTSFMNNAANFAKDRIAQISAADASHPPVQVIEVPINANQYTHNPHSHQVVPDQNPNMSYVMMMPPNQSHLLHSENEQSNLAGVNVGPDGQVPVQQTHGLNTVGGNGVVGVSPADMHAQQQHDMAAMANVTSAGSNYAMQGLIAAAHDRSSAYSQVNVAASMPQPYSYVPPGGVNSMYSGPAYSYQTHQGQLQYSVPSMDPNQPQHYQ